MLGRENLLLYELILNQEINQQVGDSVLIQDPAEPSDQVLPLAQIH